MRDPYLEYERQMEIAGLDHKLTSVARIVKEQFALYAQGREPIELVNKYRHMAGLPPITPKENLRKVTWTLKSDHLIDLDDGIKENDFSRAFDIVLIQGIKTPHWDLKVSVNKNAIPDYREAAEIGKKCGFDAGFFWTKMDAPHYSWRIRK